MNEVLNKIEFLLKNENLTKEESMKLIDQYCLILEKGNVSIELREVLLNDLQDFVRGDTEQDLSIISRKNENFIQDVSQFFQQNSCKVYSSERDTTFKYREKTIKFDLKIEDTISRDIYVVETETDRQEEQYFIQKLNTYHEFSRYNNNVRKIWIVTHNYAMLHTIEEIIYKWVKKHETLKVITNKALYNNAVITFATTTLTDLQFGKIQEIYIGVK